MFIVIEGLDGVGKTTTAELLATTLKGEFFSWLHAPYTEALPLIWSNESVSEASKHIAFLAAFRHMSDIVASTAYRGKTVITDRYYFCPFAVHKPLAALARETALNFTATDLGLTKPDFAFYLALDEESRRKRLATRGKHLSPVEFLLDQNPKFCEQVTENYENMAASGEMIRIATEDLSPTETIDAIIRKIGLKRVGTAPR
jgi:thymidylate kinase